MSISKIKISNFKSFEDLEIDLNNLNILIGGNASGKSNFVQIFQFIRDIYRYDLRNAISIQGGIEYLRNINIGSSKNFKLDIYLKDLNFGILVKKKDKKYGIEYNKGNYGFELKFKKEKPGFDVINDHLILDYTLVELNKVKESEEFAEIDDDSKREKIGTGTISFSSNGEDEDIKFELKNTDNILEKEDIITESLLKSIKKRMNAEDLIINTTLSFVPCPMLGRNFDRVLIYDLDPKLCKKAISITGKADLEENGSNLPIVLQHILENPDKEKKLSNLVTDLLPFVSKLDVERFVDTSLILKLRETYSNNKDLPATLLSDGTINITALIVALYFEGGVLNIFEEPERTIHPNLIPKLLEMFKEASEKKQIILTTHNPQLVKNADLKDLFFISRDEKGISRINKLEDKKEVKIFLENQIGIDELFINNLLGV